MVQIKAGNRNWIYYVRSVSNKMVYVIPHSRLDGAKANTVGAVWGRGWTRMDGVKLHKRPDYSDDSLIRSILYAQENER